MSWLKCKNCYNEDKKQRKKEQFIITLVVIISVIFIFALILSYNLWYIPFRDYSEAITLVNNYALNDKVFDFNYDKYIRYFEQNISYKDNYKNLVKLKYAKAKKLIKISSYDEAIEILKDITDYEDSSTLLIECQEIEKSSLYNSAVENYNSGSFDTAKSTFEKVKYYNDSQEYLNKIDTLLKLQGTYKYYSNSLYVISGWNFYYVLNPSTTYQTDFTYIFKFEDNHIGVYLKNDSILKLYDFEIVDGNLKDTSNGIVYTHTNTSTSLPDKIILKEPAIGMTKTEVLESIWGTPNKKNIDTYSWGTHEQWVCNHKGYIYFKNGIVTSISTR